MAAPPAGGTTSLPLVKASPLAADHQHTVAHRRSADRLAARQVKRVAAKGLVRLTLVHIGHLGAAHEGKVGHHEGHHAQRHLDHCLLVVACLAIFKHRNLDLRILAQAVGKDAARNPTTNDDIVVHGNSFQMVMRIRLSVFASKKRA